MIDYYRRQVERAEQALRDQGATESDLYRLFNAYRSGAQPDEKRPSKFDLQLRWDYYNAITALKRAEAEAFNKLKESLQ